MVMVDTSLFLQATASFKSDVNHPGSQSSWIGRKRN